VLKSVGVLYRVLLPAWVFKNANSTYEIRENAERYLSTAYPDRELVKIERQFALCKPKN